MKLHPREKITTQARMEIESFLLTVETKYNLTYGELQMIIGGLLQNLAKYQIRQERHPEDPDKPGGLA